jgi:hypothetical protein
MKSYTSRIMRFAPFLPLLILGACTTVLGIEDVEEDPNAGKGGSDATTDVEGGTKNTGGSSSPTMSMGGTNGQGGDGPGPLGGDGNIEGGNGPIGGDGNIGGAPNPVDPTVHGRIVDIWGHALVNVPVQIGEQQEFTDDKGQFTFEDVPATYDVSFVVRPEGEDYGWVFQGLTRRDPTLQVYAGRDQREANVLVKTTGATRGINDTITAAFGTPDGVTELTDITDEAVGVNTTPDWRGPATTSGTAHALFWTNNNATKLPSAYKAYQSKLAALSVNTPSDVTFDLTPAALTVGNVAGSVTPVADDDRENSVFLRFKSNAFIQVANETTTAPNNFSYLVPQLPDCSVTVMAREGYYSGPMGLAHRDGLSPGDTSVTLDIPEPAQPLTPASGEDNVTMDTKFNFKPSADNKGAFVVWMENFDYYQILFIVTSKKQFTIPEVAGGIFVLDANQFYRWRVETHGEFATVDEMTSPAGYIDEFGADWSLPVSPKQEDGSYTLSGGFGFTTAP